MRITEGMIKVIRKNFEQSEAETIIDEIETLDEREFDGQHPDRIVGATVILMKRNVVNPSEVIRSATVDWRDLLMGAGLADDDWPLRLGEILSCGNT